MAATTTLEKLKILADAAKYDASCSSSGSKSTRAGSRLGTTEGMGICHSYTPDGRCVSLLKILFTNYCIFDCQFCVNRVTSDTPRARFTVTEVVNLTLDFYRRNYIEGLFLSSGIIGTPDETMELLVSVARTLRDEHQYGGYIHLKTIPGACQRLIDQAGQYADRLSVNIELPTAGDLKQLAPEKKRPVIESAMTQIHDRVAEAKSEQGRSRHSPRFAPAGQSTQMIVGATPTPDRDILTTAGQLYDRHHLRRVYYSAYSPIPHADARLPGAAPPLVREHRLYQADWLLRFYGFEVTEITPADRPNLSLDHDPKMAWALANRAFFPVDLNRACREEILRVPGIGTKSVTKILTMRRWRAVRSEDARRLGLSWKKSRPFVTVADDNPGTKLLDRLDLDRLVQPKERQLTMFDAITGAATGEF